MELLGIVAWIVAIVAIGIPLCIITLCTVCLLWKIAIDMVHEVLGIY